jgi:lactoylglutathione lyase
MESKTLTKGFRMNHIGIRVANLEKSIEFYSGVLGMQELHRMALDTVTVVFLGYPDPAGSETPVFAREGVLEIVCPKVGALQKCHI